jgi:hypothetical protein
MTPPASCLLELASQRKPTHAPAGSRLLQVLFEVWLAHTHTHAHPTYQSSWLGRKSRLGTRWPMNRALAVTVRDGPSAEYADNGPRAGWQATNGGEQKR